MAIVRINDLPASTGVTSDDLFIILDDPSGSKVTKKVTLSQLSSAIGGGSQTVVQKGTVNGNVSIDVSQGNIFDMTLDDTTTIQNPTNANDGDSIRLRVTMDGNDIVVNLGNKFVTPSSSTPIVWSTGPGETDLLAATYDSSRDKWDIVAFITGY